jgi:hypothetical protein
MSAHPHARFAVFGLLALLLAAGPARADIPEILACVDKTDNAERLACYDAAAAKFKKQISEAETKQTTMFGFKLPFLDSDDSPVAPKLGPKVVNQVDAKIKDISVSPIGHQIITLDNGQVWVVNDYRLVPRPEGSETRAQIVRNIMGGFYLGIDGDHNDLLVTRVK